MLQQPGFLDHAARVPMRPIPFAEPGTPLPGWVTASDRPLVYLTLGTIVASDEALRPAVDGLGTLEVDVLLALGSAAGTDLGPVPSNIRVEPFVDQAAVLRRADLVVHHGGSGTILGALVTGTPQVLLPKGADQFFNADKMAIAGLADVLEPSVATAAAVADVAANGLARRRPAVDAARDAIAALPEPADVLDEILARFT
jgi:UDP:flavonoid glycosyltransferase YjiC (YdhE family)